MTRFLIDILPEAEAEISEAFLWYFERSPLAADAFRIEAFQVIDGLTTDALMWPEDKDGVRRHILRRFPYTISYEIQANTVIVLAVAHQRRKPGYWRDR